HYAVEDPSPTAQKFLTAYKARFNAVPDALGGLGYDSAMVLFDAMKRAGTTDGAKWRDAIAKTRDFAGVTGRITLDADRNANKPAVVLEIKDGKFVFRETINPERATTSLEASPSSGVDESRPIPNASEAAAGDECFLHIVVADYGTHEKDKPSFMI